MKKFISLAIIAAVICVVVNPAYAMNALSEREAAGAFEYVKFGTATLRDTKKEGGTMVLTVSSSPDATYVIFDEIQNIYCKVSNLPVIGDLLPGCEFVDFGEGFLHYVDNGMKVKMLLKDPATGEIIGDPNGYTMKDGQVIWLGSDHTTYEIWFKQMNSVSYAFVRLQLGDNITWEDAQ